jgi:hypothetical protein
LRREHVECRGVTESSTVSHLPTFGSCSSRHDDVDSAQRPHRSAPSLTHCGYARPQRFHGTSSRVAVPPASRSACARSRGGAGARGGDAGRPWTGRHDRRGSPGHAPAVPHGHHGSRARRYVPGGGPRYHGSVRSAPAPVAVCRFGLRPPPDRLGAGPPAPREPGAAPRRTGRGIPLRPGRIRVAPRVEPSRLRPTPRAAVARRALVQRSPDGTPPLRTAPALLPRCAPHRHGPRRPSSRRAHGLARVRAQTPDHESALPVRPKWPSRHRGGPLPEAPARPIWKTRSSAGHARVRRPEGGRHLRRQCAAARAARLGPAPVPDERLDRRTERPVVPLPHWGPRRGHAAGPTVRHDLRTSGGRRQCATSQRTAQDDAQRPHGTSAGVAPAGPGPPHGAVRAVDHPYVRLSRRRPRHDVDPETERGTRTPSAVIHGRYPHLHGHSPRPSLECRSEQCAYARWHAGGRAFEPSRFSPPGTDRSRSRRGRPPHLRAIVSVPARSRPAVGGAGATDRLRNGHGAARLLD